MNTVIVTGPHGCGKTVHSQELMLRYGCDSIVDNWSIGDPVVPCAMHLTHEAVTCVGDEVRVVQWPEVLSQDEAR